MVQEQWSVRKEGKEEGRKREGRGKEETIM